VLQAMFLTKLKVAAALVLAVTVLAAGAGLLGRRALAVNQAEANKEATAGPAKPANDRELIQGTWKLIVLEFQGRELTKEERSRAARVVLKPDKLLLETSEGLTLESDYRLDPLQKTIDVIPREGGEMEKGKTFSGIYLLDGDRLKICLGSPEQKRPGEFSTKDGKGYMLYVLQREPAVKGEGDLKEQLQ